MARWGLVAVAVIWVLTGIYIFFLPQVFYDNTPGLDLMGPFSIHFIRDVGLVYLAAGGITLRGALTRQRALALAGTLWPALHGLFHIQIWGMRGFPFDGIFMFDSVGVMIPALLGVVWAWRLQNEAA